MTPKQARFVSEYLIDLNATAAAKRAGYKNPEIGRQLITKNNVAAARAAAIKKREKKTEITAEYVLRNLKKIAEKSMGYSDAPHQQAATKALELLGKHLGMFRESVQMDGELRIHPGKRECIVLDFGDNCGRHDLCNLGSLLSDDDHLRKARDGETVKEAADRIKREEDEERRGQIQITDVSMEVVNLFRSNPHNWLPLGKDYVLEAGAMRLMALRQETGAYTLKMVRGRTEQMLIAEPVPLEDVLSEAKRVVSCLPSASRIARKDSEWRYDPATDAQRRKMDQLKIQYSDDVTSGQASALITQKEVEIERKKKEPATDAQLRYLRALGIQAPEHCTKVMAGYLIGRGRSGAGRYA